jgi:hypothetical protein
MFFSYIIVQEFKNGLSRRIAKSFTLRKLVMRKGRRLNGKIGLTGLRGDSCWMTQWS